MKFPAWGKLRSGIIPRMRTHDAGRHPGPWQVMKVDSESAGVLIALGFFIMAFVSMPLAAWFVGGAVVLGGIFALLLAMFRR